ncbi:hypothetical protein ACFQV2_13990 [Actinokineospora soli]|uniref:Uncharacterized protein n=1 Tax=Actinokineospora soli TaxID=1048753 RepID=A0ABW2TNS8_9PSEU
MQADRFTPESLVDDVDGWWHGFFSFYASGPPGHRLRELLALVRAGLVRFVGPDMEVRAEPDRFTARSPAVPGVVSARTLIDARLPDPSVDHAADPLLRAARARRGRRGHPAAAHHRAHQDHPAGLLADARGAAHPAGTPSDRTPAPDRRARSRARAPTRRASGRTTPSPARSWPPSTWRARRPRPREDTVIRLWLRMIDRVAADPPARRDLWVWAAMRQAVS